MFSINDVRWRVAYVPPAHNMLIRTDGSTSIGSCDNSTHTIYLDQTLRGTALKKVLCHEIAHAAMFSYHVQLKPQQQEVIADLIATYGQQIIAITNKIFKKLQEEYIYH